MTKEELAVAESATDFMYHWMLEEICSDDEDAINAAQEIYTYLTGKPMNNIEGFLGFE